MDGIDPGFSEEAGLIYRIPIWILILSILFIGIINFALFYTKNESAVFVITICSFIGLLTAILFARFRWIKWLEFRNKLINATLLLNTVKPEPRQIKVWRYEYAQELYVGIMPDDGLNESPMQVVRVEVPFIKLINIDTPIPAELFISENMRVIRYDENKLILLATEKNAIEMLADYPLMPVPRKIPWFIQFQILTCCGIGLLMMLFTYDFSFGSSSHLIIENGLGLVVMMSSISGLSAFFLIRYGYKTLRNIKYAPIGWAIATEVIPPVQRWTFIVPEKQTVHLQIRDQQGDEYTQIIITRQLMPWPTFIEIPVFIDPSRYKHPQQASDVLTFCNIDKKGNIKFRPYAVVDTILFIVFFLLLSFGLFFVK